jgi:hypothetical protein
VLVAVLVVALAGAGLMGAGALVVFGAPVLAPVLAPVCWPALVRWRAR